jgi:hypothetical protein
MGGRIGALNQPGASPRYPIPKILQNLNGFLHRARLGRQHQAPA